MYIQPLFSMSDPSDLQEFIRTYPLATLMICFDGRIEANLLPLVFRQEGPHGVLAGHIGRTHHLWTHGQEEFDATVVFQSPNAYISPQWYVNGQRSGRNAPSWNYIAVEALGKLHFIQDPAWMRQHLELLVDQQESAMSPAWSLDQADPAFIDAAAAHLIGFEIDISAIIGKKFLSQQRTQADRESVIRHLRGEKNESSRVVSALISFN